MERFSFLSFRSRSLYNKDGFKGLHGKFTIKDNLSKHQLRIYKVYEKKFPNHKIVKKIKILKSRERERFHEFLITKEETPYCHDIGDMYKISKKENKKPISIKEFSSETSKRISQEKLHKTINELINDYITN